MIDCFAKLKHLRLPGKIVKRLDEKPDVSIRRRLVSGSDDSTVRLWDPDSGALLTTLRGHVEPVNRVRFAPDGLSILSISSEEIKIWRTVSRREVDQDVRDHVNMAHAYRHRGQAIKSVAALKKAIAVSPDDPRLQRWLADALALKKGAAR